MEHTTMHETEQPVGGDEDVAEVAEQGRKGLLYLLAAFGLMLIPIVVGIVMANTGGDPDESSGMPAAPDGGATVTVAPSSPARLNLALEAVVLETSSDFSDTFQGANAIDGLIATEWSSRGDGDDAYIVIDLGEEMDVTGIGFRTREMTDGSSITNTFTVTIDDGEVLGPFDAGVGLAVNDFTASGRIFRIDMESTTGGNTGAVEIEIYGS